MHAMFQKFKANHLVSPTSGARVVDGKLILSFPDAIKPVLWQMDIVSAKASALEVETLQGGQAALMLKTPKGEQTTVAVFESREAALSALMTVGAALGCAHGQIRGAQASVFPASSGGGAEQIPAWAAPQPGFPAGGGGGAMAVSSADGHQRAMRWIAGLAGIVLLAVLLNTLWSLSPRPPASLPSAAAGAAAAGGGAASQASASSTPFGGPADPDAVGVPLSADAVLGRP